MKKAYLEARGTGPNFQRTTSLLLASAALFVGGYLLPGNTAFAQQANDDNVQAEGIEDLGTITIYGTRQSSKPLDVPANITVFDGEALDDTFVGDMQQLTRYTPGITVNRQTSGTDPFDTFGGFTIRGVGGNRVQMLTDGSRIPERIVDGTRDYLDFNFTKQVDIVHGPGSVLWGADALGGIVALSTVDPEDYLTGTKTKSGEVEFSYDSLDNKFNSAATYAHRINEQFSVLGGLSYSYANEAKFSRARADGGIWGCPRNLSSGATPCNKLNPADKNSYRGLAKLVFTPDEDHRIELSGDYLKRHNKVDYNHALGTEFSMFGTPRDNIISDYDRELDLYRARFAIEHEWDIEHNWFDQVKWSLAYAPNGYERTGIETKVLNAGTSPENVIEEDFLSFDEKFLELDVQLTSNLDTGPLNHTFTWGFDGDITWTDYERLDVVRNLTKGTVTRTPAGGFNFANATTRRADLFLQDQIAMFGGRLELTPGVRYATYNIDPRTNADYKVVTGSEPREISSQEFLFSLGANFDLTDHYSVYGAFNQGFKMPTAQQLYTSLPGRSFDLIPAPNLRPETVDNYEVGFRGQYDNGYFSITAFHADYTDFIDPFYNPPGTNDYTYRNLSSVKIHGIEAAGSWQMTDSLRADASVAWQYGIEKASPGSAETTHTTPPVTGIFGLNYQFPDYNITLDAITTVTGNMERVSSSSNFTPGGYALLDLYGKWKPTENTELRLGVKNALDRRYFQSSASSYSLSPGSSTRRTNPIELQTGPGRTFEASFNYTF